MANVIVDLEAKMVASKGLRAVPDRQPLEPLRILELRSAEGAGGGPEKTILAGAVWSDPNRFRITVCYICPEGDDKFNIGLRASRLGVDFVEIRQKRLVDPGVWSAVRALVRDRQTDIVHAHDYKTNLLAYLLAKRCAIIPMSTAHGWSGNSIRERLLYYPVDRWLISRFPRAIAVSTQIRNQLVRAGCASGHVQTILNGIDPGAFRRMKERRPEARIQLGVAPNEFLIGAVGRLEPEKRFDLLLKAVRLVCMRGRPCSIVFAGEGSHRDFLARQANNLGLGESCRFLGHWATITEFYDAVDLFVQSSATEGTSNSILEAMAMETPIVATDVGGTGEMISDGIHGLLVEPENVHALADAIERVITNPEATAQRVKAARAMIETKLSFTRRMQAVEAIYEDIYKAHRRG